MTRQTNKDIAEMLDALQKAHELILLMFRNKQPADALKLLGDCQECALRIGEAIEESEGMGTRAVSFLEAYCEQLFQMSQCRKRKKERADWKREMDKSLLSVREELAAMRPGGALKIVFMPYKASMWDCMESVWEAAEADEGCEAFVVPVPYFERNEKGGEERLCYEGPLFPERVPIVPYQSFSLEREQPDVIYIHNPYDDGNRVASVHPDYYSANLKKHTDMLVYIPYFFTGKGPMPETHLNLPAYHAADRIIAQDEEKARSLEEHVAKEKIIALGSPKVDRLLKLEKKRDEILETGIPPEWREKTSGRKVILYNVSVTGILQNDKHAMDKIRYVLSCFEQREDAALWWRPHPLIEATLKSMRPEIYAEYMGIKRDFMRKGRGILDETGDAGIAAVVADAYLGEGTSSLPHYFGALGKPVLHTSWTVLEDAKTDRDCLHFITFCQEGNELRFVPANQGLAHELYRLDMGSGELRKELTFPGSPEEAESCYCGIRKIRNKLVLIPHNAEDIYIYDIERKQASKIVLSESVGKLPLFDKAAEYGGKLFLLPKNYPAIVRIDLETGEVREHKECVEAFLPKGDETRMFTWAYHVKGPLAYMASCNASQMLIFNLEDGSHAVKKIGEYPYGYGHMIYDGDYFWLGAIGMNRVIRWDEESGDAREYGYPVEPEQQMEAVYCLLLDQGEKIIVCHGHDVAMSALDKETGACGPCEAAEDVLERMRKESVISWGGFASAGVLKDGTAFLFNRRNSTFYTWNMESNEWKGFPCRMTKKELLQAEKRQMEKRFLQRTSPYFFGEWNVTIPQFADYVCGSQTDVFGASRAYYERGERGASIGASVHEYIKKLL